MRMRSGSEVESSQRKPNPTFTRLTLGSPDVRPSRFWLRLAVGKYSDRAHSDWTVLSPRTLSLESRKMFDLNF